MKHEMSHREMINWLSKIPAIQFPPEWKIRIWPPFAGALIRFQVNDKISVYLDVQNNLGSMDEPYWEIYPDEDGDTSRCYMNEIPTLLELIRRALVVEEGMAETNLD